jgi:hypothetical protein
VQPADESVTALVRATGDVERRLIAVARYCVDVRPARQQQLGHSQSTAVARLPEGFAELLLGRRRIGSEELRHTLGDAERGCLPKRIDAGAPLEQQPRYVPAAVAHRILERASTGDRRTGGLDVGSSIDQRSRDVDVIVAGGPVQKRLRRPVDARTLATTGIDPFGRPTARQPQAIGMWPRRALGVCAVAGCSRSLADCVLSADGTDEHRGCAEAGEIEREIHIELDLWLLGVYEDDSLWKLAVLVHGIAAFGHDYSVAEASVSSFAQAPL